MTSLQHHLHAAHVERLARFAAAVQRPPQLPSPAQPPPIEDKPLMPQPPPVAEPIPIEDMPKHPSWFWSVNEVPKSHPSIKDIQRAVAAHYRIDFEDILSERLTRNIVRPRQVAMYLAKTLTVQSLAEIGRRFGGRDHATAIHAVRKIEALRARDSDLSTSIATLMRMLKPALAPAMQGGAS